MNRLDLIWQAQFTDKLSELAPLPDILKCTQMQLTDSQNHRKCLEGQIEELNKELQDINDKVKYEII